MCVAVFPEGGDAMHEAFSDILVVYRSEDGVHWVAHSGRTDQIGIGDDVVSALREVIEAVRVVLVEASEDPSVVVYQAAPPEVLQKIASERAKPIPKEVWACISRDLSKCGSAGYWGPESGADAEEAGDVFFGEVSSDLLAIA